MEKTGKEPAGKKAGVKNTAGMKPASNKALNKKIGLILAAVQLVATMVFAISLLQLAMLPTAYLGVIVSGLFIILVVITLLQLRGKKSIVSKILSLFMSIILIVLSVYVFKANDALKAFSNTDGIKIDNMVVVVLEEDPAETIKDAKDYTFGVQYEVKGEETEETIEAIEKELGSEITIKEYKSMHDQLEALQEGKIEAVIFDEALLEVQADQLAEELEVESIDIKTIYTYEIHTKVEEEQREVDVTKDSFIVYISGIDVYGSINKTSRSDVNILAIVNPTTHKILLVTTPRDYYVPFPGITNGQRDKLTHAAIYGVDVSMATLDELYDINCDYYARVNFTSLIEIVDALGGIDVYSEVSFTASHNPDGSVFHYDKGTNHLNGKAALAFCRERHNLADGDYQRGKNQEAVLKAIIEKLLSPAVLKGAGDLLASVEGNVETNMGQEDIQKLIQSQLKNPASWEIDMQAAYGEGAREYCYSLHANAYVCWPDETSVANMKSAIQAVME